jgi:hypothetical protein
VATGHACLRVRLHSRSTDGSAAHTCRYEAREQSGRRLKRTVEGVAQWVVAQAERATAAGGGPALAAPDSGYARMLGCWSRAAPKLPRDEAVREPLESR